MRMQQSLVPCKKMSMADITLQLNKGLSASFKQDQLLKFSTGFGVWNVVLLPAENLRNRGNKTLWSV
jgi:hypothetical protein